MATVKNVERLPSGRLKYRGETFAGFNKPKNTPVNRKKVQFLLKKVTKSSWFGLATRICRLKKTSLLAEKVLERVTSVTPPKINFLRGFGRVKRGD